MIGHRTIQGSFFKTREVPATPGGGGRGTYLWRSILEFWGHKKPKMAKPPSLGVPGGVGLTHPTQPPTPGSNLKKKKPPWCHLCFLGAHLFRFSFRMCGIISTGICVCQRDEQQTTATVVQKCQTPVVSFPGHGTRRAARHN